MEWSVPQLRMLDRQAVMIDRYRKRTDNFFKCYLFEVRQSGTYACFVSDQLRNVVRGFHISVATRKGKMAPVSGSPMEMVDQYVKNNKVMMFSKTTCPFCTKVKKLFDQEKIKFEVLELDQIGKTRDVLFYIKM